MLAKLKSGLAELERAAQAAEGRDDDLAGMVAGLNRTLGALVRVLEEERPGTAARLLAALDEAAEEPVDGYSERVTEGMRSMLGCIQEFLVGVGKAALDRRRERAAPQLARLAPRRAGPSRRPPASWPGAWPPWP